MSMELTGKVVQVMPVTSGMGKNGSWAKQDFVMETGDKYPKKVCMTVWGEDMINKYDLVPGMTITAHLDIESKEYNGKWYTNIKAWKITWDEQKRPDFPKKEAVKEQEWPEPKDNSGKWPTEARNDVATDDLPF
jgi:hypothetical protein